MKERDVFDILKLITGYLNNGDIPYMIVGGITLAYHGLPRTTEDIDILIFLERSKIKDFIKFLKANDFEVDEEDIESAFSEESHFTIFDDRSVFRIDVKGVYDDLDKDSFSRRKKIKFRNLRFYVNTAEDAIVAKLVFGSPRDLDDAKGIFERQKGNLDLNYLKKQCRKFNILDIFERIMI